MVLATAFIKLKTEISRVFKSIYFRVFLLLFIAFSLGISFQYLITFQERKMVQILDFESEIKQLNENFDQMLLFIYETNEHTSKKEAFYERDFSKHKAELTKIRSRLINNLEVLQARPLSEDAEIINQLKEVTTETQAISNATLDLLKNIREIGFKNYGAIGQYREMAHALADTDFDKVKLYLLRKDEKDFIIRLDTFYVSRFNDSITHYLEQYPFKNEKTRTLLSEYQSKFNFFASMRYGLGDGFSFGNLHKVKQSLKEIKSDCDVLVKLTKSFTHNRFEELEFWRKVLVCVGIIGTIIMLQFFTTFITGNIRKLAYDVDDFVKTGFDQITFTKHKYSGTALSLLANNIWLMQKEIAQVFKEYKLNSEMAHGKIERAKNKIEIQKFILEEKKKLLQAQNENINSSIRYAYRIQRRILPSKKDLVQSMENFELYYKPKDIVSGDFYWIKELEGKKIFAVADCTGHGVPGSLLSMLGVNMLNHAVEDIGLTQPAEILDYLNKKVIKYFSGSNHDIDETLKEGFDITIVTINYEVGEVSISSACGNSVIIRDGVQLDLKFKRKSVGGFPDPDFSFTEYKFSSGYFEFFLLTDGIVDQFGGDKNKKLKIKPIKKLLSQEICIREKHDGIINIYEQWKQFREQTDDVTLISFSHKIKKAM